MDVKDAVRRPEVFGKVEREPSAVSTASALGRAAVGMSCESSALPR